MGEFTNTKTSNIAGIITFILMTAAAVVLIFLELIGK
jgi:hypothetical protein